MRLLGSCGSVTLGFPSQVRNFIDLDDLTLWMIRVDYDDRHLRIINLKIRFFESLAVIDGFGAHQGVIDVAIEGVNEATEG